MGWPMSVLLFGLALIGGCCYSFANLSDSMIVDRTTASGPSVGVLVMENEIFGSIWATEVLDEFENDPNIKSVVIRINSPGGAVAPCQEIYQAVRKMDKKVVISMGSVAASGGLYVAVAGDVVMANPGTLTGSIGVIMQLVEISGTMEKLGIKSQAIKSGAYKDMGSPMREMRPDEQKLLQAMVDEVYGQFVKDLAVGRPNLNAQQILQMADGRIFTGAEAHKLGLVDKLGSFEDALALAAELGGLSSSERPTLVVEDGTKPWWDTVMHSKLNLSLDVPPVLEPGFSLKYLYQPDLGGGSLSER